MQYAEEGFVKFCPKGHNDNPNDDRPSYFFFIIKSFSIKVDLNKWLT